MIPWLAVLVWAYVVVRLLQIPVEYEGQSGNARMWLVITSLIGGLVATIALMSIWSTGSSVPPPPQ